MDLTKGPHGWVRTHRNRPLDAAGVELRVCRFPTQPPPNAAVEMQLSRWETWNPHGLGVGRRALASLRMKPLELFWFGSEEVQIRPELGKATLHTLIENWRRKALEGQASFTACLAASLPYDIRLPSSISDPLMCLPAHQWPEAKEPFGPEGPI